MPTIYLDHAAATPLDSAVFDAMLPHLRDNFGNPSSIHHVGRRAFDALEQARTSIAQSLSVQPGEIIFTSGGTESDNLAILGLARANQIYGKHIIVSAIEHKAVLEAATQLMTEGFSITFLPVDEYGAVDLAILQESLTPETILVSIMYANNEIGTIEPIKEIATLLTDHYKNNGKPLFHTDACQAVGILPINPTELGVDTMSISAAKIYGPKSIGLLYLKTGTKIVPLHVGGGQETGRRAGTENVALAVGFAEALTTAVQNREMYTSRLASLQTHLLAELHNHLPSFLLNGHPTERLPNNVHICIPNIEGESILLLLDNTGICAATGSACNATDLEPSHVLRAIGRDDDIIHGSLRLTLGKHTTKEELSYTAKALGRVVKKLSEITASNLSLIKK